MESRKEGTPPRVPDQLQRFAEELRRVRSHERAQQLTLDAQERAVTALFQQELRTLRDLRTAYRTERSQRIRLQIDYLSTIRMFATATEARDRCAQGHSAQVAQCSMATARRLGFSDQELADLEVAALLHDIGTIGVPDSILNKSAALEPGERFMLQQHPSIGADLLRQVPLLASLAPAVETHHERWDGNGYPARIGGARIPLSGRIIAVADAFAAMTSGRVHRPAMDHAGAQYEIVRGSGTQFDPDVVTAFTAALEVGELAL